MGDKKGDQQARAELLGKLLIAIEQKPYLIKHGTGTEAYFMIALPVTDAEVKTWTEALKAAPTVISMGPLKLVTLQLEQGSAVGTVDKKYYDPADGGWTDTVSVMRFK